MTAKPHQHNPIAAQLEMGILRGLQRSLVRYVEGPGPEDVRGEVEDLLVLIDSRIRELLQTEQIAA